MRARKRVVCLWFDTTFKKLTLANFYLILKSWARDGVRSNRKKDIASVQKQMKMHINWPILLPVSKSIYDYLLISLFESHPVNQTL